MWQRADSALFPGAVVVVDDQPCIQANRAKDGDSELSKQHRACARRPILPGGPLEVTYLASEPQFSQRTMQEAATIGAATRASRAGRSSRSRPEFASFGCVRPQDMKDAGGGSEDGQSKARESPIVGMGTYSTNGICGVRWH